MSEKERRVQRVLRKATLATDLARLEMPRSRADRVEHRALKHMILSNREIQSRIRVLSP